MNTLGKITMAWVMVSTLLVSPVFSQENTIKNQQNKTLSAGIGFPTSLGSMQARIGIGAGGFPDYEGSNDYSAKALPIVDIEKPSVFFIKGANINANDGLASAGLTLFHLTYMHGPTIEAQFLVGPLIRVYQGRDEDGNDALNGMGDIDYSASIGAFLILSSRAWLLNFAMAPQNVGNNNGGLLTTLDAAYTTSINNKLKLSSGLSASWADDDYMQNYFGVTNNQAANTELPQFDINAGLKDIGVNLKTTYALSKHWILDGQVGYWRLLNDTANSPLVDNEGSENQIRGLIGLSYQF